VFVGALSILVTTLPIRNVVPALATGYSSTILADSPAAYWRLDESSGTSAADATSHSNTGTYTGGFTLGQPGALFGDADTAVKLDGASGYVSVPNSATLQTSQVSIELWIKKLTETPWGAYVSKNIAYGGAAGSSWFQLLNYGTTGRLQFRVTGDDSPSSLQSSSTLSLNTWYYVVATYDGTTAKLYVNGSLDSTLAITATPTQTTNPLNIGRRPDGYYNNAVLDEVAIYSSALSATQIGTHWGASVNPPGAPTSLTVTIPASNQAKVTWVDPASQGASAITGYTVTPHVGSSIRTPVTVAGATATTTTLTGLSAGSYTFTVAANNANGSSVSSAASASATVTGTTYGYSAAVLGDNPAAYWRLGEATGTVAADATGQGATGTYFGTRTQNQAGGIFGDPDHAVTFDGSTGYVIAPSTAALRGATVSIELSLKKVSESANGTYVSKNFSPGGGAGTGWFELMNQGTTGHLQFRVTGDTADVSLTSNRVLALNTWYDDYIRPALHRTSVRWQLHQRGDRRGCHLPDGADGREDHDPLAGRRLRAGSADERQCVAPPQHHEPGLGVMDGTLVEWRISHHGIHRHAARRPGTARRSECNGVTCHDHWAQWWVRLHVHRRSQQQLRQWSSL
jgi:Concanavalin A-like lectin/glucanases superfamily/Fibronectin type III domain